MYVYFQQMKTRQYGKVTEQGIHLKKPTGAELADALQTALKDGFKHIYVYDSATTIVDTADKLKEYADLQIGWSNFCLTIEAFRLDFTNEEIYYAT